MRGESTDDGGGMGEGDPLHQGGPAIAGWALQANEAENTPEEALNTATLAQFGDGPGRRAAVAILLILGLPGDRRDRAKGGADPMDAGQFPIRGIHANSARPQIVAPHRPGEQELGEGGVMAVGGGDDEEW